MGNQDANSSLPLIPRSSQLKATLANDPVQSGHVMETQHYKVQTWSERLVCLRLLRDGEHESSKNVLHEVYMFHWSTPLCHLYRKDTSGRKLKACVGFLVARSA